MLKGSPEPIYNPLLGVEMNGVFSKQAPDMSNAIVEHKNLVDADTPEMIINETTVTPETNIPNVAEDVNITAKNELSLDNPIVNSAQEMFASENTNQLDNTNVNNGEEIPPEEVNKDASNPLLG